MLQLVECSRIQSHIFLARQVSFFIYFEILILYVPKYSVCELIMEVDQGQNGGGNKEIEKREQNRTTGFRDSGGSCRMWIRGPDGDRGPKAAWHLTCFISSRVTFPPATVLQLRTPRLHTEIAMTTCGREKEIMQNQGPRHGLCVRRDWGKQPFCLGSIRITDAKTTPNPLQANYMCRGRGWGWALTRELQCLIHKEELIGNLKIESTLE